LSWRRVLGCIKSSGVLEDGDLVIWREEGCGEFKASALDLSEDLTALGVPHYTTITKRCQPPWRSAGTKLPPSRWEKVRIRRVDLPLLAAVAPSLAKLIGEPSGPAPEVNRDVQILRRADGSVFFEIHGEEMLDDSWSATTAATGETSSSA
jgi:hypothetical protein